MCVATVTYFIRLALGLEIAASDTWDSKKEAHCPHSPTYSRGGLRQVVPLSLAFFICKVSKVEPSS